MEISDHDSIDSSDDEQEIKLKGFDKSLKKDETAGKKDEKAGKEDASAVAASSKAKEKKIKDAAEGDKKPKKIHLRKDKGYGDYL